MMTHRQKAAAFWLGGLLLAFILLVVFGQILLPFIAGAAFAYALHPTADWLERQGLSRFAAAGAILALLTVLVVAVLILLVPLLINQMIELLRGLPSYLTRLEQMFGASLDSEWARFLGIDAESIRTAVAAFTSQGVGIATTLLGSLWTGGWAIVDIVSLLVVTPFITFYLLRDWHHMIARVDQLLPRDQAEEIRRLGRDIDHKVSAFVRGQLLVGLLLGIFYAIMLVAIGLNYGLLIGLSAGVLSFIPYLGFTVGFVVSIVIAIVQFWPDWPWLLAVVLVFSAGELLEGYILQPRLIGRSVGLHPVWLIFSLFAFGLLFGFVGLLIAIPLGAAIGVIFRFGVERYQASALYRGTGPADVL
jgi:predicted PurR-regulated permease PerM